MVNEYYLYLFAAIIEHVRDGCTVRAFLLPDFHHVTVMMSGIKVIWLKQLNILKKFTSVILILMVKNVLRRQCSNAMVQMKYQSLLLRRYCAPNYQIILLKLLCLCPVHVV